MRFARSAGRLAWVVVSLAASGGQAAVIIVPDHQPTIQAAVTAAQPGDVVQVRPGMYAESVRVERGRTGLVLEGLGGRPTIVPPSRADGIRVDEVDGVVIRGLALAASGGRGVRVDKSVGCTLDDLIVTGARDGLFVRRGSGNTVTRSSVSGALSDGIHLERSPGAVVSENTVDGSGRNGIQVKSCDTATVTDNAVSASAKDGIQLLRADLSLTATGNAVVASGRVGVQVKKSNAVTVTGNSSAGAGKDAFVLQRIGVGTFDGNTGTGAAGSGVRVRKCLDVSVANSAADMNGQYGFWVQQSPPLDDAGDLTGAGNAAMGNGAGDFRVDP